MQDLTRNAEILEAEKKIAAEASLDHVRDGMVVGLGTGSTAAQVVRLLARRVRDGLTIRAVPTSRRTKDMARDGGISLVTLEECLRIDVTIDGTDEWDSDLNLIKGGGGALLHEKIVASASRKMIVVADSTKKVDTLGHFPLPVEVIPFAQRLVAHRIGEMGAQVSLRRDETGQPMKSLEGNFLIDCAFGEIRDPGEMAATLSAIPGVVEHGLFVGFAEEVIVGYAGKANRYARSA